MTQLPLFIVVWCFGVHSSRRPCLLQASPWGRVFRAIREDEEAAAALGKNVLAYKLQSLDRGRARGLAGFFLALNVTYLYPSEFDPTFTFLRLRGARAGGSPAMAASRWARFLWR